ncbi:hypothetical protein K435DRAFT_153386 [Dendrothele bispora CBS 962.96]|uniref:Uncharacterized protein n=1 Tax=Dendrothele bispora (strain CBS 962.96) TaxID=1314807 RepID=A0A4S8LYL0_DENBC|nr:hypothetical protein K435DRAFT_153386 [Dendrothele bispora CBS 962.96]
MVRLRMTVTITRNPVQAILLPLLFGYPFSKAVTDLLQSRTREFGSEQDLDTFSRTHRASSSFYSILRLTYGVFSKLARQHPTSHPYSQITEIPLRPPLSPYCPPSHWRLFVNFVYTNSSLSSSTP